MEFPDLGRSTPCDDRCWDRSSAPPVDAEADQKHDGQYPDDPTNARRGRLFGTRRPGLSVCRRRCGCRRRCNHWRLRRDRCRRCAGGRFDPDHRANEATEQGTSIRRSIGSSGYMGRTGSPIKGLLFDHSSLIPAMSPGTSSLAAGSVSTYAAISRGAFRRIHGPVVTTRSPPSVLNT